MELKDRIALARKQAGLSQEQLGDQLGVSRQAVSKWEAGQANPDVTYVAAMCRLFGVSSDWLLLGEEAARSAAPERCPGCQAIVSGLDRFCSSCGRGLREGTGPSEGFTLLLKSPEDGAFSPREDLIRLSKTGMFREDSPLRSPLTWDEAEDLARSAPVILAKGLSAEQVQKVYSRVYNPALFAFFQDCGDDPQVLNSYPGIDPKALPGLKRPREPLSFGMMALACVLGFLGALFLFRWLIDTINFITHII